jgi:hypothetical protein
MVTRALRKFNMHNYARIVFKKMLELEGMKWKLQLGAKFMFSSLGKYRITTKLKRQFQHS